MTGEWRVAIALGLLVGFILYALWDEAHHTETPENEQAVRERTKRKDAA